AGDGIRARIDGVISEAVITLVNHRDAASDLDIVRSGRASREDKIRRWATGIITRNQYARTVMQVQVNSDMIMVAGRVHSYELTGEIEFIGLTGRQADAVPVSVCVPEQRAIDCGARRKQNFCRCIACSVNRDTELVRTGRGAKPWRKQGGRDIVCAGLI